MAPEVWACIAGEAGRATGQGGQLQDLGRRLTWAQSLETLAAGTPLDTQETFWPYLLCLNRYSEENYSSEQESQTWV